MRRWRQPSRQHDAADFLLHLQGLWQSYDSDRTLCDEGGVCPLILSGLRDDTSEPLTSAQSHICGLNRFSFSNEHGISGKLYHCIHADPDILPPQWSPASSRSGVIWRTYQLQAVVQHLGPTTVSGHYRAALKPIRADIQHWHHTDDAQSATSVLPSSLETSSYLLLYQMRCAATS